jgi:hypothetical protein
LEEGKVEEGKGDAVSAPTGFWTRKVAVLFLK